MNRDITDEEREIAAEKASKGYRKLVDELNIELSSNGQSTDFAKTRKHTRGPNAMLLGGWLTRMSQDSFMWINLALNSVAHSLDHLVEAVSIMARQWPTVREQMAQGRYLDVVNTMDDGLGVSFATVAVSPKVADILSQQLSEVKVAQATVDERFKKSGFMGPFREEKMVYDLKHAFGIRHDAQSGCYGHCQIKVAKLEEALGDPFEDRRLVHTFGVIWSPATTSRGVKVGITADGEMTQNDLVVAEKAAPVISVPPHLKMVLG